MNHTLQYDKCLGLQGFEPSGAKCPDFDISWIKFEKPFGMETTYTLRASNLVTDSNILFILKLSRATNFDYRFGGPRNLNLRRKLLTESTMKFRIRPYTNSDLIEEFSIVLTHNVHDIDNPFCITEVLCADLAYNYNEYDPNISPLDGDVFNMTCPERLSFVQNDSAQFSCTHNGIEPEILSVCEHTHCLVREFENFVAPKGEVSIPINDDYEYSCKYGIQMVTGLKSVNATCYPNDSWIFERENIDCIESKIIETFIFSINV